ncbi:hypothetical protein [Paracoccus litorisediminis]|uniref:Uncharacterized protein n=1 Tax=Paracoccus litorisediminis TaxID=2006130 RepID=A0A844HQP2_9RHOB|nr:hypothetical protein [Paracoccus litorisediminis]MTH62200.1 hypothetical protein [Paracoccus litorisediminis]
MKYAILFRTHYWTDYLAVRFSELKSMAPGADVYVAYDATNGKAPDIPEAASHSLASLRALGLYLPEEKALWYCGDYPFYDFYLRNPNYDFYLMIENDVYLQGIDIDRIVAGCLDQGVDILGAHFLNVKDTKPGQAFHAGCSNYDVWRKCFFPVVGLRRSALVSLFSERLRQAERKERNQEYEIPFCETYVGSESLRQGWANRELGSVTPLRTYGASKYMLHDKISTEYSSGVWHSVFPADRYIDSKINLEYRKHGKNSFTTPDLVSDLRDAITYAKVSADNILIHLVRSTNGKVNKELFNERISNYLMPNLSDS